MAVNSADMDDDDHPLLTTDEILEESEARGSFSDYICPLAAEFLATAIFVFIGTTSVVQGDLVGVAVAHGLTIALLVVAFGNISGAHINPAVTLGIIIAGGISWLKAVLYVVAQLTGSLVGAAMTRGFLSYEVKGNITMYEQISGGGHALAQGIAPAQAVLGEIGLTMVLVLVILLAAVDTAGTNPLHPLAIGFTVCVDIIAAGGITGASMNPARSFGPAVILSSFNTSLWHNHWVYWVGPFSGACVAGAFYRVIFAKRSRRLFKKWN